MSIDREMATAYLLGELSLEDRSRFESQMSGDGELRAFVEELRPVLANLESLPAEAWDPVEPPPLDIARATAADPEVAPLAQREDEFDRSRAAAGRTGRRWPRLAGLVAGAAALLLVGFFIGTNTGDEESSDPTISPGPALALERLGEAPASAHGEVRMVSSEGDQMRLDVSGLAPSPDGEFYELWLLGEEGELIALGSFRVGEHGTRSVELPLPVEPSSFKYFDVSIQPEDGDPGHSGRSVLRGLTTS